MAKVPGDLKVLTVSTPVSKEPLSDIDADIESWLIRTGAGPGGDMDILTPHYPWQEDDQVHSMLAEVYARTASYFDELKPLDRWLADCVADGQLMAFMSVEKHTDAYEANQNDRFLIVIQAPGSLSLSMFDSQGVETHRVPLKPGMVIWFDENLPHEVIATSNEATNRAADVEDAAIAFNVPSPYLC